MKLRLSSELHYYQRCATSLYILVKMAQNVMEHRSLRFISEPHMVMLHNQLVAHFERIFGERYELTGGIHLNQTQK